MFSKPPAHFLVGPGPFKRMGIQLIVLWPSGVDMVDQFLTAVPGAALQVTVTEDIIKQFRLIEPGGMHRGKARPPPRVAVEVVGSGGWGRGKGDRFISEDKGLRLALDHVVISNGGKPLDGMNRVVQ
jgi:hypothetical protein